LQQWAGTIQGFTVRPVMVTFEPPMNPTTTIRAWTCFLLLSAATLAGAEQKWMVHEWGTFTSLQDEAGKAIGGINTDDEPVPPFVHQLDYSVLLNPSEASVLFKGVTSCHPDVTMRLETPVIYFHPPESKNIQNADVAVKFHGGWLTEFYPDAVSDAPGLKGRTNGFPHLLSSTASKLEWKHLKIGGDWPLTNTFAHVWTSPRAVSAASVQAANGESEKFLFYRGVAHIDAPLKVSRESGQLVFRSQLELPVNRPLTIHSLWLVDIRPDGKIAFRPLPSLKLDPDSNKILATTGASFDTEDFSTGNRDRLKASLKTTLVSEGLFDDEAQALLNTWELSYFKSAGLRVFFIVPRAWTDFHLPLEISVPADINRVMVGRIELVTPEQRKDLQEFSRFSAPQILQEFGQLGSNFLGRITFNFAATNRPSREEVQQMNKELAQVDSGQKALATFISVPKSYQTYLDLGRFRNALVLDEAKSHPTEGLTNFIATYRLQACLPRQTPDGL
jgi:hypothetical protein